MLKVIAMILLLFSCVITTVWRNTIHTGSPQDPEGKKKIEAQKRKAQKFSIFVTLISLVYTMFLFYPESGWSSAWGAIAIASGVWGVIYIYKCRKKKVSPLDGVIVANKFYNFMLTEVPFCYLYVFTWFQLGSIILFFPE